MKIPLKMNDTHIVLSDNRKLGYEDYGDKADTAIIIFYGTPGSRIGGLEDSPLMNNFNVRFITPERPGYAWRSGYSCTRCTCTGIYPATKEL